MQIFPSRAERAPRLKRPPARHDQAGFTLIEVIISVAIMMVVSGTVLDGVFRLSKTGQTVSNRSAMHSGVRNATELLQQEVGQAGRVALPNLVRLTAAVTTTGAATATVKAVNQAGATISGASGTSSMFVGEQILVGAGASEETVTITGLPSATQFTAVFGSTHLVDEPVRAYGGFAYGVIPTTVANGSTGTAMKIIGDINSDGNIEYLQYDCVIPSPPAVGNLYRRTMAINATTKPTMVASMSLLNNVVANPDLGLCFTYQERTVAGTVYVVDVAITLTVQTQDKDAVTGLFQTETKALLNVSPRNVFNVWQLAGLNAMTRVQPNITAVPSMLPANVSTLIGLP